MVQVTYPFKFILPYLPGPTINDLEHVNDAHLAVKRAGTRLTSSLALRPGSAPLAPSFKSGSGTAVRTAAGGVAAFFVLESYDAQHRFAIYSLRVSNHLNTPLVCRVWVVSDDGAASPGYPTAIDIAPFSQRRTDVPVWLDDCKSFSRALAEIAGDGVECIIEASAPPAERYPSLSPALAAVGNARAAVVGLAVAGAGGCRGCRLARYTADRRLCRSADGDRRHDRARRIQRLGRRPAGLRRDRPRRRARCRRAADRSQRCDSNCDSRLQRRWRLHASTRASRAVRHRQRSARPQHGTARPRRRRRDRYLGKPGGRQTGRERHGHLRRVGHRRLRSAARHRRHDLGRAPLLTSGQSFVRDTAARQQPRNARAAARHQRPLHR